MRIANILYTFTAKCLSELLLNEVMWTVENPRDSLMWNIDEFKALANKSEVAFTYLQSCAFGSEGPKWVALLQTLPKEDELPQRARR